MFSKTKTEKSIKALSDALKNADVVVVGAGAGLSTSAGFEYGGERFKKHFSDFACRYGFHDMYTGGFYEYRTLEEFWAYWSRYIYVNRYMDAPLPVYNLLYSLVKDKDYFVITTNVDHCFQKAGFEKKRLFYTQGDYGLFQCSGPCCQETWDNEDVVRRMYNEQADMKIPSSLIPRCPHCGRPADMNLRKDDTFVEDKGWHLAAERYHSFLRSRKGLAAVYLELGVGYNTPGIIKYPFWQLTAENPRAVYAAVNKGQAMTLRELEHQSICINEDIGCVLNALLALA